FHYLSGDIPETILIVSCHHVKYVCPQDDRSDNHHQFFHCPPPFPPVFPKSRDDRISADPFSIIWSAVLFSEFSSPSTSVFTITIPSNMVPIMIIRFFMLTSL